MYYSSLFVIFAAWAFTTHIHSYSVQVIICNSDFFFFSLFSLSPFFWAICQVIWFVSLYMHIWNPYAVSFTKSGGTAIDLHFQTKDEKKKKENERNKQTNKTKNIKWKNVWKRMQSEKFSGRKEKKTAHMDFSLVTTTTTTTTTNSTDWGLFIFYEMVVCWPVCATWCREFIWASVLAVLYATTWITEVKEWKSFFFRFLIARLRLNCIGFFVTLDFFWPQAAPLQVHFPHLKS